ncbi:MAG: alpha/beta fold hydrolase [Flavobacteriaceae bacterium]|nr:alpha/beta fold hydrolase [Flavobacteriaceae bacterium]
MPIIESSYQPKFPFSNTHFNTTFRNFFTHKKVVFNRKRLELSDGDFIDLDFLTSNSKTVVICFHGLEGSSQSKYTIAVAAYLQSKKTDVIAVNLRGCSGEPNRIYGSYHSGKTDDLNTIINHVSTNYDYQNIILLGYSLGGNITLKYLGEQGLKLNSKVICAVTVSVPCDLAGSSRALSQPSNKLYLKRFVKRLKKKMFQKNSAFPNSDLDSKKIESVHNLYDIDTLYTAPSHGFKSAEDYWEKASSKPFLHNIQIPTLLVSALDDTFLSEECYPFEAAKNNSKLFFECPKFGGHVGFNSKLFGSHGHWLEKRIFEFIIFFLK